MLLKDNLFDSQHLAIFVTDADRSQKFYEQFGFEEILNEDFDMDNGTVRLRFLKFNNLTLELVELPGEISTQSSSRP